MTAEGADFHQKLYCDLVKPTRQKVKGESISVWLSRALIIMIHERSSKSWVGVREVENKEKEVVQ